MCLILLSNLFIVLTCPPLTAPDNGDIDCSLGDDGVPHEGDTCSFTCDDGYDLNGTNARTCQNDGTWSGTQAMCSAGIHDNCTRNT